MFIAVINDGSERNTTRSTDGQNRIQMSVPTSTYDFNDPPAWNSVAHGDGMFIVRNFKNNRFVLSKNDGN